MTAREILKRLERMKADRSYREFANDIGVSAGYIYDILHGRRTPGPAILAYMKVSKRPRAATRYVDDK